jgi:hypothetical protein
MIYGKALLGLSMLQAAAFAKSATSVAASNVVANDVPNIQQHGSQRSLQSKINLNDDSIFDDDKPPQFDLGFSLRCSATCDASLCNCLSTTLEPATCASELHSVCTSGEIDQCVPPSAVSHFGALHCPYAKCILANGSDEECACRFYEKACDIYGEVESMGYCKTSECCKGSLDDIGRKECLVGGSKLWFVESVVKGEEDGLTQNSVALGEMNVEQSTQPTESTKSSVSGIDTLVDEDDDENLNVWLDENAAVVMNDVALTASEPTVSIVPLFIDSVMENFAIGQTH